MARPNHWAEAARILYYFPSIGYNAGMEKPSQLRWFQFSLAALLLLATILCVVSAATRLLGGIVIIVAAVVTLFRITHQMVRKSQEIDARNDTPPHDAC